MAQTIRLTRRPLTKRRLLFLKDCAPESLVPRREHLKEAALETSLQAGAGKADMAANEQPVVVGTSLQ